jgi:hypothetical protein
MPSPRGQSLTTSYPFSRMCRNTTHYAISKGVTLRDDSILVQPPPRSWYHVEMAVGQRRRRAVLWRRVLGPDAQGQQGRHRRSAGRK